MANIFLIDATFQSLCLLTVFVQSFQVRCVESSKVDYVGVKCDVEEHKKVNCCVDKD